MKKQKTDYRLRNWNQYNRSLIQRGSLTFWIEEGIEVRWLQKDKTGKKGARPPYSDLAITTCLSLGIVLRLPLRQSIGLVRSLFERRVPPPCRCPTTRRSRAEAAR